MKLPKLVKLFCSFLMAFMMTNLPAWAWAEAGMIATSEAVADLNRAEATARVQDYLSRTDVQRELEKRGVSPEEAKARLASLSDSELRQLSGQVEQARAGGDILVTILIVLLIIFLIKRI